MDSMSSAEIITAAAMAAVIRNLDPDAIKEFEELKNFNFDGYSPTDKETRILSTVTLAIIGASAMIKDITLVDGGMVAHLMAIIYMLGYHACEREHEIESKFDWSLLDDLNLGG